MSGIKAKREVPLVPLEREVYVEMSPGVQWAALCMSVQGWELGGGVPGPWWCLTAHSSVRDAVFAGCSHNEKHILKTLCGCFRKKKMWEQKIPNPSKSLLIQSYLGVRGNSAFKVSLFLSLFQDSQ